jgi:tetratricopeptide (TPR) repeat protein
LEFWNEGSKASTGQALAGLGDVARDKEDLSAARNNYEEALKLLSENSDAAILASERTGFARLLLDEGKNVDSANLARQAAESLSSQKRPHEEALARACLAQALMAEGQSAQARSELDRSLSLVSGSQARLARLEISIATARITAGMGAGRNTYDSVAQSISSLESAVAEARARHMVGLELEAELARDEIEVRSGRTGIGRAHLAALQKEAEAKGFLRIAHHAAAVPLQTYPQTHQVARRIPLEDLSR